MAGYTPRDSIVILPFAGSSSVGLFRFDLPTIGPQQFAASALGIVCRLEEATGMIVVLYADSVDATPNSNPFAPVTEALRLTADACGIEVGDVITVARNGWFSEVDNVVHSHREIGDPPDVGAPKPKASQSSGTRLPRIDADRMRTIRAQVTALEREHGSESPREIVERLGDVHAIFEAAVEAQRGTVDDDAVLLWLVARPSLRDVAMSQWCHGISAGAKTLEFQLDWLDGSPNPPEDLFLMGEGPAPDPDRLRAALRRVRQLAASASGRDRAAPLACAAWLSWALGMSTHAASYAQKALRAQPRHGLAQIVASICANGHLPLWAFPAENRRST